MNAGNNSTESLVPVIVLFKSSKVWSNWILYLKRSSFHDDIATCPFQAVGVFLAGCFVFTFLAMLEYSVASYLERGNHKISARRMSVVSGGLRPSAVDLCSRGAFPLAFALFLAVYWTTCLLSVPALPDDVVMLSREGE